MGVSLLRRQALRKVSSLQVIAELTLEHAPSKLGASAPLIQ